MGIGPGSRLSSGTSWQNDTRNPNPSRFKVLQVTEAAPYLIALVQYEGVTTFEGRKILVLKNLSEKAFRTLTNLDPHFTSNGMVVARFRPTDEGIDDAFRFVSASVVSKA